MPKNQNSTKELFAQFGEYNERLRTLVGADKELSIQDVAPPQRRLPPSAIGKPILHFWQAAKTLYDFINNSWQCACQQQHYTNLLLQHRTHSEIEFNVLFLFESRLNHLPQSWTWQDISFKPAFEKVEQDQEIGETMAQKPLQEVPISRMAPQPKKHGMASVTRVLKATKLIGSFGLSSKRYAESRFRSVADS